MGRKPGSPKRKLQIVILEQDAKNIENAARVEKICISELLERLIHGYMADKDPVELAERAESMPRVRKRTHKKICQECGAEFDGHANAKYCPACRGKVRARQSLEYGRVMRPEGSHHIGGTYPCKRCGKDYVQESSGQRYCRECAKLAYREYTANIYRIRRDRKAQEQIEKEEQQDQKQ